MRRYASVRVYPRRCGEAATLSVTAHESEGLSPQVRGSPRSRPPPGGTRGSIPAGAGKAAEGVPEGRPGEGLSPQVRGSRWASASAMPPAGSIPAGAGKPMKTVFGPTTSWVYPRRCGEALSDTASLRAVLGLSPQVRGSPPGLRSRRAPAGSIPAGAGKPSATRSACSRSGVYPRRCGEALLRCRMHLHVAGLSPQVRGSQSSMVS